MTTAPAGASPPDLRSRVRHALRLTAGEAHTAVPDADGVGVTLLLHDGPVYAGSNPFSDRIDEVQYGLGEGPCVSAVRTAQVVQTSGVGAGEPRWARFGARAGGLALRSAVSTPVVLGSEVIGSLNLYGRSADSFASSERSIVRCAEDVGTSVAALHLLAVAASGTRTLAQAVSDRADVDLAVGVLMDRYTMSAGAARILLSQLARLDGVSTAEAGRGLVGPGGAR